jgi:hypothetical protein
MSTHHILSTPLLDASVEDIIQEANSSVDPWEHPNATSPTIPVVAVVTQGSQTLDYIHGVNLTNNNDRHHTMPLAEPPNTPSEVPHDPHLISRHGECLSFSILLHSAFWNLSPLQCP